jgi:hypothetical protein
MHIFTAVIIPPTGEPESIVAKLIAPYCFNEHTRAGGDIDWYVIGGRWKGVLNGYDPTTEECDIVEIASLHEPLNPFALVTPNGEWHESGLPQVRSEGVWKQFVQRTLLRYPDHRIVVVDCHI